MEMGYHLRRVSSQPSQERWYKRVYKVFGLCEGYEHGGSEDGTSIDS